MTASNGTVRRAERSGAPMAEIGVTGLAVQAGRSVEEPLRQLQGDRWREVVAEMVTDEMVAAVLFAVEQLIRQVKWSVRPGDDTEAAQADAAFVDECRMDMSHSWEDWLSECLSMLPWGWSYFEQVYKLRGGDTDDPRTRSRFDDGKLGWRKWAIRGQESLYRWEFDPDGGIQAMVQRTSDWQEVTIPIARSLLFRTTSRKNDPEGKSVLRGAYRPWYYKQGIQRIEAVGVERDLAGLPVVWGPPELFKADASPEDKAVFETLRRIATNIKRDEQEGLVFPLAYDENSNKLYDIKLLTTGGSRQFDTDKIIGRYDLRIAMTVLADFILLGSKTVGSYALSSDKTNLFAVALGAWLDTICAVVNRFAIPRLLRLNGRPVTGPVPCLEHGDVEAVDWSLVASAIQQLTSSGLDMMDKDWQWLRERLGMPVPTLEEMRAFAEEKKREALEMQQQMAGPGAQATPGVAGRPTGGQGQPGQPARGGRPGRGGRGGGQNTSQEGSE